MFCAEKKELMFEKRIQQMFESVNPEIEHFFDFCVLHKKQTEKRENSPVFHLDGEELV